MQRRQFTQLLSLAGLAAFGSATMPNAVAAAGKKAPNRAGVIRKPNALKTGDTIGMVLPASMAFEPADLELAREQIEAMGFKVVLGKYARNKHGYFAGTDAERAADINAMFADDSVDGIFCYSGGWGSPRLLPLLNYDAIAANPKVFLGYSDITALLNNIYQQTGLITFHGPVAAANIRPWTYESLKKVLMSAAPIGELGSPPKPDDELVNRSYRIQTLRGGRATGHLVGGNLSLVAALMGTPWQINTRGAILLLEDIDEAPYRVDRMLTQLALGGAFDGVAGVVFGYCTECKADGPSFSMGEVLTDRLRDLNVPVMSGFAFGHLKEMHTLPIGLKAVMDADKGTLTFAEGAVR